MVNFSVIGAGKEKALEDAFADLRFAWIDATTSMPYPYLVPTDGTGTSKGMLKAA